MATCDSDDDPGADTCFSLASPATVATDDDREKDVPVTTTTEETAEPDYGSLYSVTTETTTTTYEDGPSPPEGCMLTWHRDGCVSDCDLVAIHALNIPWAVNLDEREDDGTDGVLTCGAGSTAITAAALVGVAATLASLW